MGRGSMFLAAIVLVGLVALPCDVLAGVHPFRPAPVPVPVPVPAPPAPQPDNRGADGGGSAHSAETIYPIVSPPFPAFDSAHEFEVFFLEAPFAEGTYGNKFGYLSLYHSGVGFRDTTTGARWGVEYDALNGVPNAAKPTLVDGAAATEMVWKDQGGVCVGDDSTFDNYWTRIDRVGSVSGAQLGQYAQWLDTYNQTHPFYELWTVRHSRHGELYVPGNTCYDFAIQSLQYFENMGVPLAPSAGPIHHRTINLYAQAAPTLIDMSAPGAADRVVSFYRRAKERFGFFKQYFGWGDKVTRHSNQLYAMKPRFPFFGTHYEQWVPKARPDPAVV